MAQSEIFSTGQLALNQPKSHVLFYKNGSLRDLYTMTLSVTVRRFVAKQSKMKLHQFSFSLVATWCSDVGVGQWVRAGIFQLEPSRAMKVPSRAELGHFNFRAENELDFFLIYSFFSSNFFLSPQKLVILRKNSIICTKIE
jgi:hypothetical protein